MTEKKETIRRDRHTKIVATLGPASSSREVIRDLFLAGVDVFRLNFSHGSHADHQERLDIIRSIEKEFARPIPVLADMQGPKLRLGTFEDGFITVEAGDKIRLDLDRTPGNKERVCLPHPEIFAALNEKKDNPGTLLVDDGKVRLQVLSVEEDSCLVEVLSGSKLSDRKGVNVPDLVLPLSALTEKDLADLEYALEAGADWIALSFVQRPEDLIEARKIIKGRASLLAKLEKPSAIDHLKEIIEQADAVMVARGDLGVEMPPEDVPALQKKIVREARMSGKPVIVATQMLESMIEAPTPTRAEASDVATAVFDGTDAVMLSAETAAGKYPLEAVKIMSRIARRIEKDDNYRKVMDAQHPKPHHTASDAITAAAFQVADTINAAAICTYTTSGSTTLRAARERPTVPILCLTSKLETARRLSLSYGVHAVHTSDVTNFSEMVQKACSIAYYDNLGASGDRLVITAGVPFGTPGSTNILRIAWIDQ